MSHTTPTQGNINHSMRTNYNEFGVDEYYRKVNASYRNPFFPGIRKVIFALLDRWWKEENQAKSERETSGFNGGADEDEDEGETELRILDMAAGSGEASLVVEEWFNSRFPPATGSSSTTTTTNNPTAPSKPIISSSSSTPTIAPSNTLPLSDGPPHPLASLRAGPSKFPVVSRPAFIPPGRKGKSMDKGTPDQGAPGRPGTMTRETTSPRMERTDEGMRPGKGGRRPKLVLMATDPYTVPAYEMRTGKKCLPLSFVDIAQGKLGEIPSSTTTKRPADEYDLVICSFALHLVGDASEMFSLLYDLSRRSRWLAVIAPHKKPEIKEGWGYTRWNFGSWKSASDVGISDGMEEDEEEVEAVGQTRSAAPPVIAARDGDLVNRGQEIVLDRVRCRLYRSVEV